MKVSIIIPVLNSHEAVKRQVRYFRNLRLPDDVEIIIADDGSNPPLSFLRMMGLKNLLVFPTNDKRPWTQGLARNAGAKRASGKYLMMTDIDHIFSKQAIKAVREFTGDRMEFPREFGVLDKQGRLRQDQNILIAYGVDPAYLNSKGVKISTSHGNTFAIRKELFFELGGYSQYRSTRCMHAPKRKGEDCYFNRKFDKYVMEEKCQPRVMGPRIFMFPVGRYHVSGENNPMGLFHNLSYEPVRQPMLD